MTNSQEPPIEPGSAGSYPPLSFESIPDASQVQQTVMEAPRNGTSRRIAAGVAGLALVGGGIFAYSQLSGNESAKPAPVAAPTGSPRQAFGGKATPAAPASIHASTPRAAATSETPKAPEVSETPKAPKQCESPAVQRLFGGDPNATDNADTWNKGVLLLIKPPASEEYVGTRVGFHQPEQGVADTEWSVPVNRDELRGQSVVMRSGPEDYTIVVQNLGKVGSAVCKQTPSVVFTETNNVNSVLDGGTIFEPEFE